LFPLGRNERNQLIFIFFLTIISAFFELLGIGLIIPILNIFVGNEFLKYTEYFNFLGEKSKEEIFVILIIFFGFIYFLKFLLLRYLILKQNEFNHKLYTDISKKFFKNYLYKNFIFHLKKHSSELIRNTQVEVNLFSFGVILPLIKFFSEVLIFFSICGLLITYDFKTAITAITFFSIIGYLLLKFTNDRLTHWGEERQIHSALVLKQLQQAFASIREIIINNLENVFLDKYHYHNLANAKAGKQRDTITQMPRLIMELIGVSTFVILILLLLNTGKELPEIFVIVGVFFFASIRLLPSVSKVVGSVQSIKFNSAVIDLIYSELVDFNNNENNRKKDTKNETSLNFNNITFNQVNFSYLGINKKILNDVNIKINKGDKIGIVGKTGSGKSTFINLFCGLFSCNSGNVKINNQNINEILSPWQKKIGYVPQSVSIIDESILFNISLENDLSKVNINQINEVLKIVDLYDHVYNLPNNIYELAGENGKNLSGGQCQRLGIARALYKNPSIIILDEATSSLDEITEDKILKKLFKNVLLKTIISVSHRKSSLKNCSKIVEIKDNGIKEIKLEI